MNEAGNDAQQLAAICQRALIPKNSSIDDINTWTKDLDSSLNQLRNDRIALARDQEKIEEDKKNWGPEAQKVVHDFLTTISSTYPEGSKKKVDELIKYRIMRIFHKNAVRYAEKDLELASSMAFGDSNTLVKPEEMKMPEGTTFGVIRRMVNEHVIDKRSSDQVASRPGTYNDALKTALLTYGDAEGWWENSFRLRYLGCFVAGPKWVQATSEDITPNLANLWDKLPKQNLRSGDRYPDSVPIYYTDGSELNTKAIRRTAGIVSSSYEPISNYTTLNGIFLLCKKIP